MTEPTLPRPKFIVGQEPRLPIIPWRDISPQERVERWEQAKRVLLEMPAHERRRHFRMAIFGEVTACGTVACAAGFCGMDPWFRSRGLQLNFVWFGDWLIESDVDASRVYSEDVAEFFGTEGADEIFFVGTPRSVPAVIDEIDEFIDYLKRKATDLANSD